MIKEILKAVLVCTIMGTFFIVIQMNVTFGDKVASIGDKVASIEDRLKRIENILIEKVNRKEVEDADL